MVQDRPAQIERRLAAILAADVAGYSRLMHDDEEATHARLTSLLTDVIHPAIAEHGGRIVKNTGDGFLAEFPSAVKAVRAAIQFQTGTKERTAVDVEDRRIAFRVGINIGDVIVEPHDIFGDGVNIAARLESIAEPDGICISSSVYDQVQGKVGAAFGDLGEQHLKNITRPVRVYSVATSGSFEAVTSSDSARTSTSSPRLSIVVLPFANLSGDPAQDYFVDGMTESLTTDLSRISGSFVIGRHTAFTYKGKAVDLKRVGRELNVNYVIEGSVQRGGNRLRVNVRLVDAEIGSHLWTDRFDKPVADLFEMQDEVTARIAYALDAQLVEAEARRAERSPHPDALDLCFQGRHFLNQGPTTNYLSHSRRLFERALALDPENIEALVGIAMIQFITVTNFMLDDRGARLAEAEATLIKVLSMAPRHARAHGVLAALRAFTNRAAQAIGEFEQALELDRNLADAHALLGFAKVFIGRGAESEAHIRHALRLSPRDISAFRWMHLLGVVKMILGADTEAVEWLRRSLEANRNFPIAHFQFAAALALSGSLDEARAAAQAGFAFDPDFTIRRTKGLFLSIDPTFRAGSKRIRDGMLMAGVPEE
ncbi:adenylate/guanylate cyclase domain-containing protein [Bradyrhizobium lupini]|uniref:adenylate/guanylate cyclase domain-containing protein n=1 Tax=Rhizobium lupini TaxID=136996 RepID=UPI0036708114